MIDYFDYRPEYERLRDEIDDAMARVLASGRLILASEVEAFETEFANYTGAAESVGVASGTDAITLALRALGIGPGDEVITVANAGVPPIAAIRAAGAMPRFVDVEPARLLIDTSRLEAALTPSTRCLMPVHLYGHPVPMKPVLEFAARHGLRVVEDCAHAHGARQDGRHVGTLGDAGCFSFYPTKVLGAYGDGGICITRDRDLAHRLRRLRMYGFDDEPVARVEGVNSRLDELQAAILRAKLRHLDENLAERRGLADRYAAGLAGSTLSHTAPAPGVDHAYHLFVVLVPDREATIRTLEQAQIGHGLHYPVPAHRMDAYRSLGVREGQLPVTERACARVLSLPLYPGLPTEAVDRVVSALAGRS